MENLLHRPLTLDRRNLTVSQNTRSILERCIKLPTVELRINGYDWNDDAGKPRPNTFIEKVLELSHNVVLTSISTDKSIVLGKC